jgi:hypothetical protein
MDSQQYKKTHKGEEIVRKQTYDMQLLNSETLFREAFKRVRCINFYQMM